MATSYSYRFRLAVATGSGYRLQLPIQFSSSRLQLRLQGTAPCYGHWLQLHSNLLLLAVKATITAAGSG
jgi:hypothetical protein